MKKPAFAGRASSVTSKHILAPSCLVVDAAMAHLHLDLLRKKDEETRLRAITYKGGGLSAREFKFPKYEFNTISHNYPNSEQIIDAHIEGRGLYFVVNDGGTTDIEITHCRAFFVEWDNIPKEKQLHIYKELNLPEPTFQVDTGGKSIHNYWVLKKPVAAEVWHPIQIRLVDYCKADRNVKNPSRVMRLAGFYYINSDGVPTAQSKIINVSGKEYFIEDIEQVLPIPEVKPLLPNNVKRTITNSDWTLRDIVIALDHIPTRVTGNNTYGEYRQIAWGLKAILKDIGLPESLAIDLMERHSPSGKVSGWNIPQVMRSGGERTGAGTFIYYAQKHGYKPKAQ